MSSVLGLRTAPISWQTRELIEIGAAIGLILGFVMGAFALSRTLRQRNLAEERLRRASGGSPAIGSPAGSPSGGRVTGTFSVPKRN